MSLEPLHSEAPGHLEPFVLHSLQRMFCQGGQVAPNSRLADGIIIRSGHQAGRSCEWISAWLDSCRFEANRLRDESSMHELATQQLSSQKQAIFFTAGAQCAQDRGTHRGGTLHPKKGM